MESARNNILARLKAAQDKRGEIEVNIPDFTSPIYHSLNQALELEFKANLEMIGGQVILCQTKSEIAAHISTICQTKNQTSVFCTDPVLQDLLKNTVKTDSGEDTFTELNVGVTGCELLVAHLGSVLISSAQISGRRLNVFPETHIVVAAQSQLTDYLDGAMEKLQNKYKNELPSLISNITGPSRTADIEKTLVMGMHGPKSLIVIISEEPI
ncbi:MAG: LUD domain-containing protein [Prolixibacteraceae bacterium]|nr:LUD domain-containing protein [Prolixibacteraceae bacterium]